LSETCCILFQKNHPEISVADLWIFAGCCAIEFMGGPKIPFSFGRTDAKDGLKCPANGRLPDASQGAEHLRSVFYRMGFNDQEIVALSGGHTLGSCHLVRSGFDGPWTRTPLKFDNVFFKNLLHFEWKKREWDGPLQYTDETGDLMMLPTDIVLIKDAKFRVYVEAYASNQELFFKDFAAAFGKLIALGVHNPKKESFTENQVKSAEFREAAMHGSFEKVKKLSKVANVQEVENSSGRTALHKAAFWGHTGVVKFLVNDCKIATNVQDYNGDTALHDAARFGHLGCVEILRRVTNTQIKNREGKTACEVAKDYGQNAIVSMLTSSKL